MHHRRACWVQLLPGWVGMLLVVGAAVSAQTIELRFATAGPARSVGTQQIERWAAAVTEETRGSVNIQVFSGGALGAEAEIVQRVARGRIEIGGFSTSFAALLVPELQLLALPLFFQSGAELECVLRGRITETISQRLALRDMHFLGWGGVAAVDLIGKRAFTDPSDLAGRKAGSFGSRVGALVWGALGAHATPTTSSEIAAAFQTGLIEVSVSSPTYYIASGLNKVAPVMTRTGLMHVPAMIAMNAAAWQRLDPDQRAAFERARARVFSGQLRQQLGDADALLRESLAATGGEVVVLNAAQREAFRKVLVPMWPRMAAESGPQGVDFLEQLKAARQGCS